MILKERTKESRTSGFSSHEDELRRDGSHRRVSYNSVKKEKGGVERTRKSKNGPHPMLMVFAFAAESQSSVAAVDEHTRVSGAAVAGGQAGTCQLICQGNGLHRLLTRMRIIPIVGACRTDIHHQCIAGVIEHMRNLLRSATFAVVLVASLAASPSLNAGCFQQFRDDMNACSELASWGDRTLCGLDADLALAGCIRRTVWG